MGMPKRFHLNRPDRAKEVIEPSLVAKYAARARRGFLDGRVIASVEKFRGALRAGLFAELEELQSRATRA